MVRQKTRWLVVEVDEAGWAAKDASTSSALSKKDVSRAIRDNFEEVMGLHGQVVSFELHVRYYDASQTKLLLLRVPRDVVTSVRASLAFLTTVRTRRVALHTVSIHGSARTAKLATVRRIRSYYREQVLQMRRQLPQGAAKPARIGQLCSSMEEQVNVLQNIDF